MMCQYCGTDLEVEKEMNSLEPLFTGHSCRGSLKPPVVSSTDYVSPPMQPDYYDRLEARRIVTGKEDKYWRAYSGSQMSANVETLVKVMQAGYGHLLPGVAVWLYIGRN